MKRTFVALLASALLAGCASLPNTDVDRKLGEESAQQVAEEMGVFDDKALAAYVSAVGERLVRAMPQRQFDYTFTLVDEAEPNAFAAPGGHVFVSRGLLALVRTEDELAGVLAHEIQHVERRHTVRQQRKQLGLGLLALPGVLVAGIVSNDLAKLVASPFVAIGARYSRDQEREADSYGQPLAAAAGYDPRGIAAILGRIEGFVSTITEKPEETSFFDSHPGTPERIASLTARAPSLARGRENPVAPTPIATQRKLEGLVFGDNVAEGIEVGNVFVQPDLDFKIAFPKGWALKNTASSVTAMAPGGAGVMALGLKGEGTEADLAKMAGEFAARVEQEQKRKPERLEGKTVSGLPGIALYTTDESGAEPVHVFVLWLADRGRIYQLIGMIPHSQAEVVQAAGRSFQALGESERRSVTQLKLRLVPARAGETIDDVNRRAKGVLQPRIVAALNGAAPTKRHGAGELVKVVVQVPYLKR